MLIYRHLHVWGLRCVNISVVPSISTDTHRELGIYPRKPELLSYTHSIAWCSYYILVGNAWANCGLAWAAVAVALASSGAGSAKYRTAVDECVLRFNPRLGWVSPDLGVGSTKFGLASTNWHRFDQIGDFDQCWVLTELGWVLTEFGPASTALGCLGPNWAWC